MITLIAGVPKVVVGFSYNHNEEFMYQKILTNDYSFSVNELFNSLLLTVEKVIKDEKKVILKEKIHFQRDQLGVLFLGRDIQEEENEYYINEKGNRIVITLNEDNADQKHSFIDTNIKERYLMEWTKISEQQKQYEEYLTQFPNRLRMLRRYL